ncbi:protein kinase C-binding protein NELL2-like [Magallana gigas]|uniref:protein kinase C-binding protein NELL2-like n=1 Tax=Magallana gigas TaxID=29159 RepID=UPI00333EAB6E
MSKTRKDSFLKHHSDNYNCCQLCIRAYSTSTSRHSSPRQNKRETNASPKSECNASTDCGENAVCDTSDTDNVCVCKPGFFDNPPIITALSDGCPGECGEFGETDQCKGNTLCTQTPQGYGVCTCPANTYGPPECLGECNEFGETDQCEGNTLCTQTPQGYGLCTCPENTYGPPECLGECDEFGETDQCEGNTLCTQTPQGYAVCTCPENTYGPPECLGECDEFGETDQCEGNTLCIQTQQGYGVCTCPENTYGPPECLAEGSTTTEKSRRNLILVYGALTIPLLFLVPAALASGLSLG